MILYKNKKNRGKKIVRTKTLIKPRFLAHLETLIYFKNRAMQS